MGFWSELLGLEAKPEETEATIDVDSLPSAYDGQTGLAPWQASVFDGEKFFGGLGPVQLQWTDYWSLRERSSALFRENLYAQGLIARLVTNEVSTGLAPEARPDEQILGLAEDSLNDWTEEVENRFGIYSDQADICDYFQAQTLGAIQASARMEALISGDVLVLLGQHKGARVPNVRLVNAQLVQSPLAGDPKQGHTIRHGVERDARGRIVAYWIRKGTLEFERLKARDSNGRRVAWLEYAPGKRYEEERGMPLLAVVLQSLKEVDRYRDSTVRKAVINSILAMFITKKEDKPGTLPMTGGATRRTNTTQTQAPDADRKFKISSFVPGMIAEELQVGEEPKGFDARGVDEKFGDFEEAIIQAVAWSRSVPPEILKLAFSNNYSASQAAINEFKIYIEQVRKEFGDTFCGPIYREWLLSEVVNGRIRAAGLLEAWRDPSRYDEYGAWVAVDWYGSIKPSTDMLKQAKGSELLLKLGLTTHAREARHLTGTKFSKNMRRQRQENVLLAEVLAPLVALENPTPPDEPEEPEENE